MNFLKGLVISLLGFLLFLSLSTFGYMLMLNYTILDPEFVVSQVDRLDIPSLAEELLSEQIAHEQIPQYEELVTEVVNNTISDLEPWIKEKANTLIYSAHDYLTGKNQSLSLIISLEPVKDSLRDNMEQVLLNSLPPELEGTPPELIEQFINTAYQQVSRDIPETFEFNESLWGPEVQVALEQARDVISYFGVAYNVLIGLMLLLSLGIVFLSRDIRSGIRSTGIIFLIYGIIEYVSIFIIMHLAGTQLVQSGLPLSLQIWIPQFLDDLLTPLKLFSLGIGIAGIVLIITGSIPWRQKPNVQEEVMEIGQSYTCPRCGLPCTPVQRFCPSCGQSLQ